MSERANDFQKGTIFGVTIMVAAIVLVAIMSRFLG